MSFNNGGLYQYLLDSEVSGVSVYYLLFTVAVIVCAYLLGSINSAIIISKTLYKDDIRKHGSGNPGMTNIFPMIANKDLPVLGEGLLYNGSSYERLLLPKYDGE